MSGVTIERFHLHGDTGHRDALLASLDSQAWPDEDSNRIVIIRQLEVRGYWWEIASKIATAAQDSSGRIIHGSCVDSQAAEAVYFEDALDLLESFIVAATTERLQQWHWDLVCDSRSVDQTLVELARTQVEKLPLLFARLQSRQQLLPAIKRLSVDSWQIIFNLLLEHLSLPLGNPVFPEAELDAFDDTRVAINANSAESAGQPNLWQPAQALLDQRCGHRTPLFYLCQVWVAQPHRIADIGYTVEAIKALYKPQDCNQQTDRSTGLHFHLQQPERGIPEKLIRHSGTASDGRTDVEHPGSGVRPDILSPINVADIQGNPNPADLQFSTSTGGFFYLINVLLQLRLVETIQRSQLHPWHWLYRLSGFLGPLDHPMVELVACQLGCETGELQELQPLASESELQLQLERYYGVDTVWQPELLELPAQVSVQGPAITMATDLSQVNTNLRLRGLDLDPGWQPWLGQVIRFEFGRYPEYARKSHLPD